MADKVIQVNVTSTKSQRVSVSPGNVQNEISATPDSSLYYSNLAKNWAIGAGLILNEDYSSKHYAKESANSASSAKNYADASQATYQNVRETSENALINIEDARVDAVSDITTIRDESIDNVNTTKTNALTDITSAKNNAVNTVNATASSLANKDLSNLSTTGQAKFDEKAYANEVLKKNQITNCILEKPKYLNWTYEGGVITLKTGSKLIYPNGFNSDGSRKFSYHTTTKDIAWETSGTTSTLRYLWASREGGANNYHQNMLYVGDTAPTLTGNYCLWYDTTNNILKNTVDKGVNWKTTTGTFPFMTAYNKDGGVGYKYPTSVFDGIGIMDSCVWVADGVKVLVPNGRNTDGTLKNTEITSKASVHLAVWKVSTTATSPLFISTSGVLGNSGTKYVESETEPTFNYVLWYNPLTNEIKYKDSAASTWASRQYAVVGFCYGTYGTPWASHFSYTEPNLKEAFRAVDYGDFRAEVDNKLSATETKATSGNVKFSNGIIVNWGRVSTPGNGSVSATFSTPFTTTDYKVVCSQYSSSVGADQNVGAYNYTTTGFTAYNGIGSTMEIEYIAIGY